MYCRVVYIYCTYCMYIHKENRKLKIKKLFMHILRVLFKQKYRYYAGEHFTNGHVFVVVWCSALSFFSKLEKTEINLCVHKFYTTTTKKPLTYKHSHGEEKNRLMENLWYFFVWDMYLVRYIHLYTERCRGQKCETCFNYEVEPHGVRGNGTGGGWGVGEVMSSI